MKRKLTLLSFLLVSLTLWAQVPQKMSFQAVIRNSSNALVINTTVGLKISVLQGTSTGSSVYVETHTTATNANGLVSLQIGNGSVVSGNFTTVNWANGPYFIKTETDPTGGSNYSISGTTELLSVPYALAAGQSMPAPGNAIGDLQYWNGTSWVLLPIGTAGQVLKVDNSIPKWTSATVGSLSTVTTDAVTVVKAKQATLTGTVVSDGGEFVIVRGFCYSTSPNPTVTNGAVTAGNGIGTFTIDITGLTVSTTYYVRAFATTTAGTAYGSSMSFTTQNGVAQVTTLAATNIAACTADSGGTIITDGGDAITSSGVCYSTTPNPTLADTNVNNIGNPFTVSLYTTQPNTLFYYRAYVQNSVGTFYGNQLSFTTQNFTATVVTNPVTNIHSCSATFSMNYTPLVPNAVENFGFCYSTSPLPTLQDNQISLYQGTTTAESYCLLSNTTYYLRSWILNCNGEKYGNQVTFTTPNDNLSVTTNAPTEVRACSLVFSNPTVSTISGDGTCNLDTNIYYGTSPNPDETTGLIASYSNNPKTFYMYNLTANTTYYIRSFVTKCDGTKVFAPQIQVSTLPKYTSITTTAATSVTAGTAQLNGSFIGNNTDYIYGGFCYSTSPNPTVNDTKIQVTSSNGGATLNRTIFGLTAGTTYYVRAYGEDSNGGSSCIGTFYGNQITFTTAAGPLVVGQNYNGGIIFYLNGSTGLIAAPTTQGATAWGCEGTSISGTLSTQGSGQANTNLILAGCTSAGTAAKICDTLVLNGKSDWYLPSEAELLLLGQQSFFLPDNYWSSTQSSATQAKVINGITSGTSNKSDVTINVRAIRSF